MIDIFVDGTTNSENDSAVVDVNTDIVFDINIADDMFAINGSIKKPAQTEPEPSQPVAPVPVTPVTPSDGLTQNNQAPVVQTGDPAQTTKWFVLMIASAIVFIVSFMTGLFKKRKVK